MVVFGSFRVKAVLFGGFRYTRAKVVTKAKSTFLIAWRRFFWSGGASLSGGVTKSFLSLLDSVEAVFRSFLVRFVTYVAKKLFLKLSIFLLYLKIKNVFISVTYVMKKRRIAFLDIVEGVFRSLQEAVSVT